jgi:hypothetical protein
MQTGETATRPPNPADVGCQQPATKILIVKDR